MTSPSSKLFYIVFYGALSVLLTFPSDISAQTPGYLGKKTSLGYGLYANPAFVGTTIFNGSFLNTQHEFFLERALKKGLSLGFSARLYRSSYNNYHSIDVGSGSAGYNYIFYGDNLLRPKGSFDIKGRNFALYLKFFRRSFVAPWGRYFFMGLTLNTRECIYNPNEMYVELPYLQIFNSPTTRTRINDFGPTIQNFATPDILIGSGISRVFANRIIVDYGFNINMIALSAGLLDVVGFYNNPDQYEYIRSYSGLRTRGVNRFNFFLKIGGLF